MHITDILIAMGLVKLLFIKDLYGLVKHTWPVRFIRQSYAVFVFAMCYDHLTGKLR